jgi:glyoxylase-like metal-dependent hydrolase (beta-lactamase superfamily II)
MVKNITSEQLNAILGTKDEPVLLDVREPEEVESWRMPNSINIPLSQLEQRINEIPKNRKVLTICASGRRSSLVAKFLSDRGFEVINLIGGMHAWACSYDVAELSQNDLGLIQIRRRGKGCLSYLIYSGDEAFAIDPSNQVSIYLDLAQEKNLQITKIFDTHLHADHVSGVRKLAEKTGAKIYLNPYDDFHFDYSALSDEQTFSLGGSVEFKVIAMHAPGHTKGSTVFTVSNDFAMTGDVLFIDGVGRPDLAEKAREFAENLYDSLANKILTLPDELKIFPAHYSVEFPIKPHQLIYETLGNLKAKLKVLSLSKSDFINWAVSNVSKRPPNYQKIIHINMGKSALNDEEILNLEAGPNRCAVG